MPVGEGVFRDCVCVWYQTALLVMIIYLLWTVTNCPKKSTDCGRFIEIKKDYAIQ